MARDFTRTRAAIAEYDECKARWDALLASGASVGKLYAHMNEEDRLAQAVGHAFGLDTSDINALDTCEACVRPDAGLRRMVAQENA